MISVRAYGRDSVDEPRPAELAEAVADGRLVWVDVQDPSADELEQLEAQFDLHPMVFGEDRRRHQRPTLRQYAGHDFVIAYTGEQRGIELFFTPSWLVSIHEVADRELIVRAQTRFDRAAAGQAGAAFLLYVLLDELVDGCFAASDQAEEVLEQVEDRIFSEALSDEQDVQHQLFELRERLFLLRRTVRPLRDVVAALLRREVEWLDDVTITHMQDVYDHVLRVADAIDSQREIMDNSVGAHLALLANKRVRIMKKMTSWATVLLGASFLAGVYGMRFEHIPELQWRFGYVWALGLMIAMTVIGYCYFKAKDWL